MAALVSILPIVLLFVLMLGFKMAGHRSAFISLLATAAIAVFHDFSLDVGNVACD